MWFADGEEAKLLCVPGLRQQHILCMHTQQNTLQVTQAERHCLFKDALFSFLSPFDQLVLSKPIWPIDIHNLEIMLKTEHQEDVLLTCQRVSISLYTFSMRS